MSRIIFLDVDGTLVDYEGRAPASAVEAIRRARAAGHRVYLSTGRSRAEVYDELWDIGLDGLIGANGGYVEDAGEVVLHQHLSAEHCRRVVDWLQSRGATQVIGRLVAGEAQVRRPDLHQIAPHPPARQREVWVRRRRSPRC